jgi:peptidoglycan hydrolase-like amidase
VKIKVEITRQENAEYFNTFIGDIVEVEFEEYVAAVVASEIGNGPLEACKA